MTGLALIGGAALRSLCLGLLTAVCLRLLYVRHAGVEKRVWTVVLVIAAAMPAAVLWHVPQLTFMAYPRQAPVYTSSSSTLTAPPMLQQHIAIVGYGQAALPMAKAPVRSVSWLQVLPAVYLLVVAGMLCRLAIGLLLARRLWQHATPFQGKLPGCAEVRITSSLHSPVTFGSSILLPREAAAWSDATLEMVLAHEAKHVAEGDFYLQVAASLHLAVFPFSPLAWWLPTRLTQLSEMMCDRAAVLSSGDGYGYAQLLLQLGSGRMPLEFAAMARSAGLAARVERLLRDPELRASFQQRRGMATGVALIVAASAFTTMATLRIVHPDGIVLAQRHVAAPPQLEPVPAAGAVKTKPAQSPGKPPIPQELDTARSYTIYGAGIDGNTIMHGRYPNTEDEHAQYLGGAILFAKDGKTWVIEDKAWIEQAMADYAPVSMLGTRQQELGEQQGRLGEQQGLLGARQGALGAKQSALGKDLGALVINDMPHLQVKLPKNFGASISKLVNVEMKLALQDVSRNDAERLSLENELRKLQSEVDAVTAVIQADQPQLEVVQRDIEAANKRMQETMQPALEEMMKSAQQQAELGVQQSRLAAEQSELAARQTAASAKADHKVKALIEQAVREGKAHPAQ